MKAWHEKRNFAGAALYTVQCCNLYFQGIIKTPVERLAIWQRLAKRTDISQLCKVEGVALPFCSQEDHHVSLNPKP